MKASAALSLRHTREDFIFASGMRMETPRDKGACRAVALTKRPQRPAHAQEKRCGVEALGVSS